MGGGGTQGDIRDSYLGRLGFKAEQFLFLNRFMGPRKNYTIESI